MMPDPGTVRQEIEQHNRDMSAAFNRGDAAAVAALYAEDAKVLPPGGAMVTGRQAIRQFWQGVRDMGVHEVTLRTEEVATSGDLAYEIGTATLTMQPAGSAATMDSVKYVVVWKRRAGGPWQLAVDIWNSDTQA
jgi:uncharacterized protein (TIGR02246 family)